MIESPQMVSAPFESPAPGPWRPYYGFQLPWNFSMASDAQRESLAAFVAKLSHALDDLSFEYRFDESGCLYARERDQRPNIAYLGKGSEGIFNTLCSLLRSLQLENDMPSFQPYSPEHVPKKLEQHRTSYRDWVGKLLSAIGVIREHPKPHVTPTWMQEEEHIARQFATLGSWLKARWPAVKALPAIQAWWAKAKSAGA